MVSASDFQPEGRWLKACCFLKRRNFAPHCLSPPRCINECRRHNAGGNPLLDRYPIQGGSSNIPSCFMLQLPG